MSFSENLQYLRTRTGTTQEKLAEQLGVSRQSVSKWESGASFPEMDTILQICDLYETNMDTLLRGSVEQSEISDNTNYNQTWNRFTAQIAFSVGAIIAAVGIMLIINALNVPEMLSAAFLLLVIAVSVVVIVAGSIQFDNFKKKNGYISDFYTAEQKDTFQKTFVWLIAGSIGAILFDVVFLLLFFSFFPEEGCYETLAVGIFLLIIACAVSTLIYAGMQYAKYDITAYNQENNPTPEEKKRSALSDTLCACIMLFATAYFLAAGFTQNAWNIAWWVFPVGGILCAIACTLVDQFKKDE